MELNTEHLKSFVKKGIKSYERYLENIKYSGDKNNEAGKIVWIIFGMKLWYELRNIWSIQKIIDEWKDVYINQIDEFRCWEIEGITSVRRVMQRDSEAYDNLQVLITLAKMG